MKSRARSLMIACSSLAGLCAVALAGPGSSAETTASAALDRPADPVVLTGEELGAPALGSDVAQIVAYRWSGSWEQIPVQVDERVLVDWGTVRHSSNAGLPGESATLYVDGDPYPDPGDPDPPTGTGTQIADDDPTLDSNDEVVFMARDTGDHRPGGPPPAGVISGTRLEVAVNDTLGDTQGYVYLFRSTSASPVQPMTGVEYAFALDTEPYYDTYGFGGPRPGPNEEDSLVTTPYYRTHFADRWLRDEIKIGTAPSAADLIDREKVLFSRGDSDECKRTVTTANLAGGAFIANKVGPVRAIRSYVAANSGLITQRDHLFYDQREIEHTYLRVHPIPGAMSFLDYGEHARGMTHTAKPMAGPAVSEIINGATGRVIDQPKMDWHLLTSDNRGSLVRTYRLSVEEPAMPTSNGVLERSYYEDNATDPTDRCNEEVDPEGNPVPDDEDGDALGSSGIWIQPNPDNPPRPYDKLPCTDPLRLTDGRCNELWTLTLTATYDYELPGTVVTEADAQRIADRATTPVHADTG